MRWIKRVIFLYTILALLGYALFSVTTLPPSPNTSAFSGLTIAHRGDALSFPENTLEAVESAAHLGADAVEIDVMMTKDGVLVAMHDDTLDRTTNGSGLVEERLISDLKKLELKNLESDIAVDTEIPTLEEVIQLVKALNLKLEIELKTEIRKKYDTTQKVIALFKKYDLHNIAFVSSFDPRFLYYLRSNDPQIVTALSLKKHPPYSKLVEFLIRRDWIVDYLGAGILQPSVELADNQFVKKWGEKKQVMNIWVVNSQREKKRYRGEFISITTDCPGSYC
ncbi:MAG: hypothetical protein KTR18_08030 [Acidiferrobacterales bacterium]|nr:hypothetical protein [Acidiferrobacterales bacterium]